MQAFEVGHVGNDDAQQVIELAGHEVTLHDLGDVSNGGLERRELALLLAVQAYMDEDISGKPGLRLIHERDVAVDDSRVFEQEEIRTVDSSVAMAEELVSNFEAGKEADFIVLDPRGTSISAHRTGLAASIGELLFALIVLGDDRNVAATYLQGLRA